MTKYILGCLLLLCTFTATADQSFITLLYRQCDNLSDITIPEFNNLSVQQHQFELKSLAINNMSDSLQYFKQFHLNSSTTEKLVNCQMELSNIWERFIQSDSATEFIGKLQNSTVKKQKQLGIQLSKAKALVLPANELARLRTMEAIFRSNLKARTSRISINDADCQLNGQSDFGFQAKSSIPHYLIKQTNENCRRLVWSKFYHRPYLEKSLEQIKALRTQQAKNNGYADYSHFVIKNNYLNTPTLINQYLDNATEKNTSLPWNIGIKLSESTKPNLKHINIEAQEFISNALKTLKPFNIYIELIDKQVFRLWYKDHLLGDINVISNDENIILSEMIKYPVIGYQFAQSRLFTVQHLKNAKQQQRMLNELAKIVISFARVSGNYLTNGNADNNDYNRVGEFWLSQYLSEKLVNTVGRKSEQQIIAQKYLKQLRVLRAKVALNFYTQHPANRNELSSLFKTTFNATLPKDNDYLHTFDGLINVGPNYFSELWQKDLTKYFFSYTQKNNKQKQFFSDFVINETNLSFESNLQRLFDKKLTKPKLIKLVNQQ